MGDTVPVPDWSSLVTSILVVGVLALLLRWAFGSRMRSVVERLPRRGSEHEYGLMVSVASPGTFIAGEVDRQRLEAAGIRARLVTTTDGPRLMVLEEDEAAARTVLASS
jgi:hypothetical protein